MIIKIVTSFLLLYSIVSGKLPWIAGRWFDFSENYVEEAKMKAFKAIDYAKDSNWWTMVKQSSNTMGLADWFVFAFCLGFPMAVGVYFMMQAKRAAAKNPGSAMEEYMMASKSAEVLPLALSIVTSFMSAITVLGVPGDVPASNTAYVWFLLTFTSVCALTALVYVPVFYNMEIKSTYEYLNR